MAGRQYQMAFEIGAKLQGQFGSAFKGAQNSVAQLQNQIQSLNKAQGDIAAYQKQQAAVSATKAKLETLQRQYALLQSSMSESGEASTQLKNQMLNKQLQIEKTSASLEQQTQKLNTMGDALSEAGVDTNNLSQASSALQSQIAGLKAEQESLAASTEEMSDATTNAQNAMQDMVSTMTLLDVAESAWAGIEKVVSAYADAIGTAAGFESSMANVAALSGASAYELEQLNAVAKELGASTMYTAQQSAEAMGFMAMAGWDTQQIIAGMPGVLSLAAAAGEDLSLVSDILTDSMTAFGLSADQSAHYADVLAATATNANTNVATMGETFKYVAPVAGALGYSVEDVSTAIGLMANAGVKGSNAGTALRNVFNGLISGANLSAAAFGDVEISTVRADGSMMDFGSTIDMLRGYFAQMTEAEQVANATAIAGQRGYSGLLAILNATDADYAKLTDSINNCAGAAERMAAIKLDTFNGQVTLLQSAVEGVKITIGEQFTPVLTQLTSIAASVMSGVNSFLSAHPGIIKAFTAAAAVITVVTGAVIALGTAMKVASTAAALLSATIPGLRTIMAVTLAVAGLAAGVTLLADAFGSTGVSLEDLDREFDTINKDIQDQQRIIDLYDSYKQLNKELSDTQSSFEDLSGQDDIAVTISASALSTLIPQDFMDPDAEDIQLSAEQVANLIAAGFMKQDDDGIHLSAQQTADLVASGFMKPDDDGITLKAGQTADLIASGFINPDDKGITLSAQQTANLVAKGFMSEDDPGITLKAGQTAALLAAGFMKPDDEGITLTATQRQELVASGFLSPDDHGITLEAGQTANLTAAGFMSADDKGITLSAQQTANLVASGFINPEDKGITLKAGQTADLIASGFMNPDDKGITLSAGQTANLVAAGFISEDDTGITLEAGQTANLLAEGFLKPDDPGITLKASQQSNLLAAGFMIDPNEEIPISGNAVRNLKAQGFLDGDAIITIKGIADTDTKITVDDYIAVTDRVVELTANITNMEDLQASVTELTQKAAEAKEAWGSASQDLTDMETRYGQLEARLKYAKTDSDKNALQTELEALSETIEEQKGKVDALHGSYSDVATQLYYTESAANALQSKQNELLAVQDALTAASDGVITASNKETEAYDQQAKSVRDLAEAKKAELKAKLIDVASKQASAYADAVKSGAEATQRLNHYLGMAATSNAYLGKTTDEINADYRGLLATLNEMQSREGFDPLDVDYQHTIDQVEILASLFGETFDDLNQYAGKGINWVDDFGDIETNAASWKYAVEDVNAAVVKYGDEVAATAEAQDVFISNLVSGVQTGTITMEEMEGIVKTLFPATEEGAEMAARAIDEVKTAIQEAEASAESAQETASTAGADMQAAMDPVIAKMTELAGAYTEAYNAAYESMSGQFDLFEQAPELTSQSVDDMIANLQSQVAYMEQYSANLKAAAEMGVSDGLLAQLSDGSKESAAYLQAIVSDGAGKIDALNASFAEVEKGKEDFASTVAEMETDFSASMAALTADLESTVTAMNLSSEAAEAGRETLQAFANGASGQVEAVRQAFSEAAAAAAEALNVNVKIPGHAAGTTDAERGWALVGENGPELMWFNGGEQVLNNRETEAVLHSREPLDALSHSASGDAGGSVYNVTVSPVYTISGTADTAELRDVLERNVDDMRSVIEEILDDINADRERSAYSL